MPSHKFPYIERILQQALDNGSTPGIALLVEKHGTCLYRTALGYAQIYPDHRTLTETTRFDIASLTKVVATTTAVMLLLRDNLITLHDPVKKYVPECPHEQITFTHLLTHTAGFPAWQPFFEDVQQEADRRGSAEFIGSPEAKQFVLEKLCQTDLLSPPGKDCLYSDLGFILLGVAIEHITGVPLDQYCHDMIFQPCNMAATGFQTTGAPVVKELYAATERCEWRQTILCGVVHDENAYAMGGVAGHAGVFSTLDDLHRFMRKLLQCYQGDDPFLPQPLVRQFFARQNLVQGSTRALGWDTPSPQKSTSGTLLSAASIGHTGFTGTSIWLDLTRQLLILLLSNRIHPSRQNQTFLNIRPKIHDTIVIATDEIS
ncbi:serine hydrolase [candidate division KSB3 bacterium]|uniref:Serine hydrolase n=1 Tax=candidate division KSB3 bacterium TaxID=2044937 RepID=A0A9D5JZB1_9BACT|nr:serine hydrolase [candidate division KSB3 bacterium]MBD3327114.1 serine hydrolase [candidate division KSB3 bacterium]